MRKLFFNVILMSLKGLLLAATMATSQLASGNDTLPVQNATNHTSQKVHDSLEHGEKHALHPHVEISAGFEHDHLLDHGQVMEGDFASLGIHASLGKWGASYHWLQEEDSSLEHKAGISFSQPLNPCVVLHGSVSGIYEVDGFGHEDVHISSHPGLHSDDGHGGHDVHKKEPALHPETEKPESSLYAAASVKLDAILAEDPDNKIMGELGAEYDFGPLDTSFVHAGLKSTHDVAGATLTFEAKAIHVLNINSTHIKTGTLGVFGAGVDIPLTKRLSLGISGQALTTGERLGGVTVKLNF